MRRVGFIVAILVATVDILYVWYVRFVQSGTSDLPWRVPFVASYLAAMAICAVLSVTVSLQAWRMALLAASAGGLLLLGFFAMFSIGLPLLLLGLFAIAVLINAVKGSTRRGLAIGSSIAGAIAAVLVLLVGFEITERIIACPPGVISGGGGAGFLTGPYSYTCQNGRAIITYGQQ
jgi:hypothetical protein